VTPRNFFDIWAAEKVQSDETEYKYINFQPQETTDFKTRFQG